MQADNAACGHDPAQFVTADEGTSYCPACEDEARSAAYDFSMARCGVEHEHDSSCFLVYERPRTTCGGYGEVA